MMVSLDVLTKFNEGNDYSRNQLLKVRKFLNSDVLDQIPILGDLRIYLEQLSLVKQHIQPNFSPVVVFQQPTWFLQFQSELKALNWTFSKESLNLEKEQANPKYGKIFDRLLENFFDSLDLNEQNLLKKKAEEKRGGEFGEDVISEQITESKDLPEGEPARLQKCAKCGHPAEKRCSDCKKYFYCSKKCQKRDLKSGHKNDCQTHSGYVKKCIEFLKKKKKSKSNKTQPEKENEKKVKVEEISGAEIKGFGENEKVEDMGVPSETVQMVDSGEDPLGFDELD